MKNNQKLNCGNTFRFRIIHYLQIRRLIMYLKATYLLILISCFQLRAETFSQTLTLKTKSISLEKAFKFLEKESDYVVLYDYKEVASLKPIKLNVTNADVKEYLHAVLDERSFVYTIEDKTILIRSKKKDLSNVKTYTPVAERKEIQQLRVTGVVVDQEGVPLPGVSVTETGSSLGTSTNESGEFELTVSSQQVTLQFSLLGYGTVEEAFTSGVPKKVSLKSTVSGLEEVVVVGYGVQKKVNLTGAVSVVKGEELARKPVGQTSAALQGAVPGLTVRQQSGQPGRDNGHLLIRGVGTMGNGMGPLVLVDGVETNINNVDPNEIESISVLKDAASAAIYGSRAAGGVILVTTKRANELGFSVGYDTYGGWQVPTDMTNMVNGLDHMNLINEAYTNTGRSPLYSDAVIEEYAAGRATNPDRYPDTDWSDLTMNNSGFMQSHHLGISSASEKLRVLGSLGYLDQDGIIPNTNFKRYSFRLNTDLKLTEKLSTAMDLYLLRTDLVEPSSGTASVFHWMRRIPANQAGLLSTGQYGEGWNGDNPIAKSRDGGLNLVSPLSSIINLDIKYKPVEWLTANLVYSPKYEISHNKSFAEIIQTYNWDGTESYAKPTKNSLSESYSKYWYNNIRALLTFDKALTEDHHLTVLGGFQQEDQKNNSLSAYREVFLLPQYQEIDAGNKENERTGGNASHWALRSFFGRINYNYQEKYLFEANARYDGSSRFGTNNKYAFFPSFSAGWRMSQESFLQGSNVISDLKIRASWGRLGNQDIGLYPFAAFVTIGGNNYVFDDRIYTGAALNKMANPDIRWETTTVSDIGIDMVLWSRLSITADYYYRKTTDILLELDIPKSIGLGAPFQNAGVVENRGWDVSLGYNNQIGDFRYNLTVNVSDVKNKVLDMRGVARTGLQVNHEGYPINSLYGYEAIGLFESEEDVSSHATQFGNLAPGDIKYKDQNGDGVINSEDEIIMGSHLPRYSYSGNIDLAYKGLDFSLFLQGVGKGVGYLYGQGIMPFYEGGTVQEQHKDRWTPDNTDAAFPRLAFNETNNIQNSTFWMKNAAYLRVKNVQLGYTVPLPANVKAHIKNLRVYASGQNLFTFDKFWEGYDPEGPVGNGSWYPQMKVYTIGLNVKF